MTNDDEKLKYKINSDIHPKISDAFYKKTLESLLLSKNLFSINNDGTLHFLKALKKQQLLITGFLLLGLIALHQANQLFVDEELLHVDTLSLSSFSVL